MNIAKNESIPFSFSYRIYSMIKSPFRITICIFGFTLLGGKSISTKISFDIFRGFLEYHNYFYSKILILRQNFVVRTFKYIIYRSTHFYVNSSENCTHKHQRNFHL
jgi:hypothetical protein